MCQKRAKASKKTRKKTAARGKTATAASRTHNPVKASSRTCKAKKAAR